MALLEEQAEDMPMQPVEGAKEDTGELTVTGEAVAAEIMKEVGPNEQEAIKILVDAGMQVLFADEESHHAIFDGINANDEIPVADEVGTGAVNLALQILSETGGSEEAAAAIVPAGTILLAKVFEFINETGIEDVSDQDFSDAMEIFVVALEREVTQGQEEQPMPEEQAGGAPMPPPPPGQPAPQPMPQQGGGLLRQGGMQ